MPDAVGWHLKAIFGKGNQPAYDDHLKEGRFFEFQMAVPGYGHEDIGYGKEYNCFHKSEDLPTPTELAYGVRAADTRPAGGGIYPDRGSSVFLKRF